MYATVYGSPGVRVRFLGFASIYGPFAIVLFLCGYFCHAAIPLGIPSWAAGICLLLLVGAAWAASDRAARRFRNYLKGAQGEELVARELALLPTGWTIFHGVPRIGFDASPGGSDYDHVVLGSGALFVVETKNWRGPVTIEGGSICVRGVPTRRSPITQVRREALELSKRFRDILPEGFPVVGIVCFASNGLSVDREQIDMTPVCNVRALRELLLSSPTASLSTDAKERLVQNLLNL